MCTFSRLDTERQIRAKPLFSCEVALQSPCVRLLHVGRSLFIGLIRVGRTDDDERRPRSRVCASGPSLRLMCVREVTDGIICRAYFSLMLG